MLSFDSGTPIAKVTSGQYKNQTLKIHKPEFGKRSKVRTIGKSFMFQGNLLPLMNTEQRAVEYVAGPSGSGKTTMAVMLLNAYLKTFPDKELYIFSRTDWTDDPAFDDLIKEPMQIPIDEGLLEFPIDITEDLRDGGVILFDDITTIQNEKLKKLIESLISDILEVGRKLDISVILTSHLILPNDKKFARTIMNEIQTLTVFPKSGTSQQIRYSLNKYFGYDNKQIDAILKLPSHWVRINKSYPNYVIFEQGCYLL